MEEKCEICPRKCGVDRNKAKGYCGVCGDGILVSRAALHFWEEPCISGDSGSGTVFFSGCNLRCIYCQNYQIANCTVGKEISIERLCEIFFELKNKGANNINLVTPTHYSVQISQAIKMAKEKGFNLPFVYNTSGYETREAIASLKGLVDIYLTDFKYFSSELAKRYSNASDYPEVAKDALKEMFLQCPTAVFDECGLMKKGIIVRHLLLPGCLDDAKNVLKYLFFTYGHSIYMSIMSQYTPLENVKAYPEINRRVTSEEYNALIDFAVDLGVENAFIQEGECAEESFIPSFDYQGI